MDALADSRYTVALTGAGVSAESGVPTFRGEGGLWRNHRPEQLATPEAFVANPKLVWEFYDWRRSVIHRAQPNPAHLALAALEERSENFTLLTQNIDGFHRAAGSKRVVELHGNLWEMRSIEGGRIFEERQVPLETIPPRTETGALLRPNVVWFGEGLNPKVLEAAFEAASRCEFMIVAGTSAVVQPAAHLPVLAKQNGAYVLEVNPEPTLISDFVDESLLGKAGEILPAIVESVSQGKRQSPERPSP
ncbi:MAG: NAD-dependent deacylase [Nitrospinota bacterium]